MSEIEINFIYHLNFVCVARWRYLSRRKILRSCMLQIKKYKSIFNREKSGYIASWIEFLDIDKSSLGEHVGKMIRKFARLDLPHSIVCTRATNTIWHVSPREKGECNSCGANWYLCFLFGNNSLKRFSRISLILNSFKIVEFFVCSILCEDQL